MSAASAAVALSLAAGCGSRTALEVGSALPDSDAAPAMDGSGCIPTTCAAAGAACGAIPDNCGASLYCGVCPEQICGGGINQCGFNDCTPSTCAQIGAACGIVSDRCSRVLDCGRCTAGEACVAGQCGGG